MEEITPLRSLVNLWQAQFERAEKSKRELFDNAADECWKYYGDKTHEFALKGADSYIRPNHYVTVNMTSQFVKLMLPYLHFSCPTRVVTPDRPRVPIELEQMVYGGLGDMNMAMAAYQQAEMVRQQDNLAAWMMQWKLNYTPRFHDLAKECRPSVIEALVKGRGVTWTEINRGYSGSFFDTIDNLFIDPDCETVRSASFIIRRRRRPVWQVASEWGWPTDKIRAAAKTSRQQGSENGQFTTADTDEKDRDVCVYYEVYSRCGIGNVFFNSSDEVKMLAQAVQEVGDYVYIAFVPGMEAPLNLPPEAVLNSTPEEIKRRMEWHTPFWANEDSPWPCRLLDFYPHPRRPWPTPPLQDALPLQRYINSAYSFLLTRTVLTSKQLLATSRALKQEFTDAIRRGEDLGVVDMGDSQMEDIAKNFQVIQLPDPSRFILETIHLAQAAFERASGLTELAYGQGGQRAMRSSAEAQIRQQNLSIRPDDLAECVEAWHSDMASAEAIMTRLVEPPPAELFGEDASTGIPGPLTMAWSQLITTNDPYRAASDLRYSVVAGSGRKPNIRKKQEDVQQVMQMMLPMYSQQYQMTGDPTQVNGLVAWMADAYEIRDPKILQTLMLQPMMMQPSPQPGQEPGQEQEQQPQEQGPPPRQQV